MSIKDTEEEIYMTFTCGGIQYEVFEHFINHHIAMGIKKENIVFCYHKNTDIEERYDTIWKNIFKKFNLKHSVIIECPFDTQRMQIEPLVEIKKSLPVNCWIVRTDTDAFIELPYHKNNIPEFCHYLNKNNYTHAIAVTVDRLSLNGSFKDIDNNNSVFEQFPLILKDNARLRSLMKLATGQPVKKNKKNVYERPKQSLVFASRNFIEQTQSVHQLDYPEDPNLSVYKKLGILHHFKYDASYKTKHAFGGSILGEKYHRAFFSDIHKTFYRDEEHLCLEKISEAYEHQKEPKVLTFNPNFPSYIGEPKWL